METYNIWGINMAKKIFKSISIGIMVFAIALLSGYVAYVIAYNHQNELTKERMTADGIVEAMPASQNAMPDYRERVKEIINDYSFFS